MKRGVVENGFSANRELLHFLDSDQDIFNAWVGENRVVMSKDFSPGFGSTKNHSL